MTAAEASGDKHAAELARALREIDPTIILEGIGGAQMAAAGVQIHHESIGKAAMGWRGAMRALEVSRWMRWTRDHYKTARPNLHICVDSSAMNLPFAKQAKRAGLPVLYYIAPQLWASREGRMKKLRAYVDRLACIFPFEEIYFQNHGVRATFVGHPLFDELPPRIHREKIINALERYPQHPPIIGIVPGSRRAEVAANLPPLIDVVRLLLAEFPRARFVVPTSPAVHGMVEAELKRAKAPQPLSFDPDADELVRVFTVQENGFDDLIPMCDLVITKSGTSTVQAAAWRAPMIVVYRLNPFLWHLGARWLIKTPKIAMVNILAGNKELVPEFIPWYGKPDRVAEYAIELIKRPARLMEQRRLLGELIFSFDRPGASMNTARMAMEMMSRK